MKVTMEEQKLYDDFTASVFQRGYEKGKEDATISYQNAYNEGNVDGYSRGYDEGVKDGQKGKISEMLVDTYTQGLNDAWGAAKKIILGVNHGGLADDEIMTIFNKPFTGVLVENTAIEVVTKIKEYEEKRTNDEVKQWDEICSKDEPQTKLIVIGIGAWGDWYCVNNEGQTVKFIDKYKKYWKKTGKSYPELANILEQLKGDNSKSV